MLLDLNADPKHPSRSAVRAPAEPAAVIPRLAPEPHGPPAEPAPGLRTPFKDATDWVLAAVLLVLFAPVMLLTGLLVRLTSPGPALYAQTRVGKGGRLFRIYKLRTMHHNCEKVSGARWSVPGDPRVTRLGRFLRKSHLDELPQLFNVLRGDMSLVGPRPERPEFVAVLEREIPRYRERLRVRPGVTGLAQVYLPPDTDLNSVRMKTVYDLCYIGRMGLWLDLRLMACTGLRITGVPLSFLRRLLVLPPRGAIEAAAATR